MSANRTTYPSEELPKVMLRLPPDLKTWLHERAKLNRRSQNSEIVHRLEASRMAETREAA